MRKISISFLIATLLLIIGCEDFLDVNKNPNNPATVSLELALPPAISSACYVYGGWWQILGGIWAQHWTQSTGAQQYRDFEDYQLTPSSFDRQWNEIYAGSLNDLEKIRKQSEADENWNYYLMSTVMQCYVFQMMVDCFDQIPYSEAFLGETGNYKPVYDDGEDIYSDLISRIDTALSKDFEARTNTQPESDDILFSGSMDSWVAFANSVKLKIYLRQVYARPTIAQAGISGLINSGATFLTNLDAAMTQFADEENRRNPVYETGVDRLSGNISASRTTLSFLEDSSDTRLDAIFAPPSAGGNHFALVQGDYKSTTPTNIQGLSTPLLSYDDPVYLMTAAEVNFLLAEAALRWPDLGLSAKEYYDNGVLAAFNKFTLDGQSYLEPGGVYEYISTGNIERDLEQIITQKWLSMANSQGVEAWLEFNRTHYPSFLQPSLNNVTGGLMPKRFLWPAEERSANPENVPALKAVYQKVWWDVKPE